MFDLTKARETAGVAVHDAADRARESLDQAGELVRDLRSDVARAVDKVQADGTLEEVGQRLRAVAATTAIGALIAGPDLESPDTDRDRYARAYARGRAQGRSKYLAVGIAAGVTTGVVAAALLEPGHGKERRDRIASRVSSLTAVVSTRAASVADVARDRARGIAVERGLVKPDAGTAVPVTGAVSGEPVAAEVIDTGAVADGTADAIAAVDAGGSHVTDAPPTA